MLQFNLHDVSLVSERKIRCVAYGGQVDGQFWLSDVVGHQTDHKALDRVHPGGFGNEHVIYHLAI